MRHIYQLLTMVDAGGSRTYLHTHVSRRLYHCAADKDYSCFETLEWSYIIRDTGDQALFSNINQTPAYIQHAVESEFQTISSCVSRSPGTFFFFLETN